VRCHPSRAEAFWLLDTTIHRVLAQHRPHERCAECPRRPYCDICAAEPQAESMADLMESPPNVASRNVDSSNQNGETL